VVGAFAAIGKLNVWILLVLLIGASVLGDTANYEIGKYFGRVILENKKVKLVKDAHLRKANKFIRSHGGKAVLLARFIPIIRTIVPFVVGLGKLE